MASDAVTDNPYTRGIAEFVSGLRYRAIPPEVLARAKLLILDALGCGIYGSKVEWSRILQQRLRELDTTPACVVWGTRHKLSAPHASLVNGTQVQGFELDDLHALGVLHTGAVVVPALTTVAEFRPGLAGTDYLVAAITGYEIGPRVGMCMNPEHLGQGWQSGGTVSVFAAASAAARGLKLNADRTVHAMGIAGTQAAGLMASQYGAMVKRMTVGRASQSGLYAAQFADAGFTGIINVFESDYGGFCTTFSRSRDRYRLPALTDGLGSIWQTMEVRLKFYACIGSSHAALDAIRQIRRERQFAAEDVARIDVHASQITVDHVGWKYVPRGLTAAQLNLSYCIAALLLDGEVFVDQFTEDKVAGQRYLALAARVHVHHDPEITARGPKFRKMVRVTVHLNDGTQLESTLEQSHYHHNFASEAEVVQKFEKLAGHVLPPPQVERLRDRVLHLEEVADTAELARLCALAG